MPYTPQQVRSILEQIGKSDPDKWIPAVNSLIVDLFEQIEKLTAEHASTRKVVVRAYREVKQLNELLNQGATASASANQSVAAPTQISGAAAAPTHDVAGNPLDEAQADAERRMNDAAGPRP